MKYKFIILLLIIFCANLFSEKLLLNEYNMLLEDLSNFDSAGYKAKDFKKSENSYSMEQGLIIASKNALDFAIQGNGFFKVRDTTSDKDYYTRNGSFTINNDGFLVTKEGYRLSPEIQADNKKSDKILLENFKYLLIPVQKKTVKYNFEIFLPDDNSNIIRNGQYFTFDKTVNTNEYKIMKSFLEMSNCDCESTIIRMIYILNKIEKTNESKDIKMIEVKKEMLGKLLDYVNLLIINTNIENGLSEIKKLITKQEYQSNSNFEELKSTIKKFTPFLKPDYE
jgi:flagellar basal-body rod protein FlgF